MDNKIVATHKGFEIVPKEDFGKYGYLIDGKMVKEGFVVIYGPNSVRKIRSGVGGSNELVDMHVTGCNAMPGATWFQTVEEAIEAIDILVDAEAKEVFDKNGNSNIGDLFWSAMREKENQNKAMKQEQPAKANTDIHYVVRHKESGIYKENAYHAVLAFTSQIESNKYAEAMGSEWESYPVKITPA